MSVLVAYASRHGSTKGIAERIAAVLRELGLSAEAKQVDQARDLDNHDRVTFATSARRWLLVRRVCQMLGSVFPAAFSWTDGPAWSVRYAARTTAD